jgi:hypothetical protein
VPVRRAGNDVIVVEVTAVESVVPDARVMTLAPNTFQDNSQVLFSLTVLGFAVRLITTGKSVEYCFETITVATAVTAPYELDAVKVYAVDVAGETRWLPIGLTLPTVGLMETDVAFLIFHVSVGKSLS